MAMFVVRVLHVCVFDINSLGNEIGIDSVFDREYPGRI